MRTMRPWIPAVLLSLACALAPFAPVHAQQHPNVSIGFNPSGSYSVGDIDNVNLFNGNMVIRIPLGSSYPVDGGLSYGLTLIYNSQVWEHENYNGFTQAIPLRTANAGLGWTLSLGRINVPQMIGEYETARDTYMSPDGARHTFYPTLHEGETATPDVHYTRDGTYLRYRKSLRTVEFPDGSTHFFNTEGFLTQIKDAFGNTVDVCTNCCPGGACTPAEQPWPWRLSDTQGRQQWVFFRATGLPRQPVVVDRVVLESFGNQPEAVYSFRYNIDDGGPETMKGCRNVDPNTQAIPAVLLTRLTLPDGSSYQMPEHYNTPTGLCKSGMIRKLVLPSLGSIEYDYINYTYPSGSTGRGFWQFTTGIGTRTLREATGTAAGTWTYTTALQGSPVSKELVNTVTDPLGHRVTRYFAVGAVTAIEKATYGLPFTHLQAGDGGGRFLSSKVFHQNGSHLRSNYLRYESDANPYWASDIQDWTRLNQRQASQRTVFHDDGGKVADETLTDFDGHGHYRSRTAGGTFPGSNVRTSAAGYNPARGTYGQAGYTPWPSGSPWVLGTYGFSWESEGGQLQYRSFCFDPNTGFLKGRRIHALSSAGYSTNDLVEIFDRSNAGNVTAEKYFGGDTQAVTADPTQGYICTLANTLTVPTYQVSHSYSFGVRSKTSVQVGGNTLFTLDQTIDRSTGLPSSSRDTAGRQTDYLFDNLGRILRIEPPDGADTTYTWRPATNPSSLVRVTVAQVEGSTTTFTESRTDFDGLGRPVVEAEQMPDDTWASRTTTYNALGWKKSVSERSSPYATLFLDYDPFGRPGRIQPPDSTGHTVTLTYAGTSQVTRQTKVATSATSETNANTTEIYDRYGRLHQVTEPNNAVTRYEYDTGNHLKRVCQNLSGSTCGQERLFTWDNRGLLLWENHPEKEPNVFGQGHDVDYLAYDARGNSTRKVDGANDLTFAYDKAGRLTQVRETGAGACVTTPTGSPRCLKSFTYAPSNGSVTGGGIDYKRGKLVSASRYNYIHIDSDPEYNATGEIKETWQYAGRGGRMSQQETSMVFDGAPREAFRQTFVWNEIGDLKDHTYPDCVTPTLCGAAAPRTQSYGYTQGRLTSVTGFAPSVTYHPSGMVAQVVRSNGLTDYQRPDPADMARPAEIYTLRTSDAFGLWTTGSYRYDGSGNVWKMGNALYLYDNLSRVVSGKVPHGAYSDGATSTQAYNYDNYGNLTSTTTNGSLVQSPASTSTNQLTGAGRDYDTSGNLTDWNGNVYGYDAFDQMIRHVSGTDEWRYLYTASDERFWSYRLAGGSGSVWTLRGPGGQVLREYNSHLGWSSYQDSIYRGSNLLATVASPASGGAVSHQHTDHLGTPRLVTDATGNPATAQYHAYYPYGRELDATYTAAYTLRQRFTGHERDSVNLGGQGDDLDYMHARHYSPVVGRFLSVDTVRGRPKSPKSWNRYTYVLGNPLRFLDPNGEETQLAYGLMTANNVLGHTALAIDGVVYSYGTSYVNLNGDWGVPLDAYLNAQPNRETALLTLNLTPEQEEQLLQLLRSNNPNSGTYSVLNHSCVTVCERPLDQIGALSTQAGTMIVDRAGNEFLAGSAKSFTPADLVARIRQAGLVTVVRTRGKQSTSTLESFVGTIWTFIIRYLNI